jgi:NADPH:quinone reductase-like Zn-dependent oxidoreductase
VVEVRDTEKPVPKTDDRVFGYNDSKFGAHAEYTIMAEHNAVSTMPSGISYEEAASTTEGDHCALCNIRAAKIKRGQEILVNEGTSAIGSAAIQLLKYFDTKSGKRNYKNGAPE